MKVKLMFEAQDGKEVFVSLNGLPCVGEQLMVADKTAAEVLQVIHTPTSNAHDAIVVLRNVDG